MNNKHSLSFLTNEWHDNAKDQIVLHALCNLLGTEYIPVMKGITAEKISRSVCKLFSMYGMIKRPTGDIGTSSLLTQELLSMLIDKKIVTAESVQTEIVHLFNTVYDADYESDLIL